MGKLQARLRQTSHVLPTDLNTDTATEWLPEHRRLGKLTDSKHDLPVRLLAELYSRPL